MPEIRNNGVPLPGSTPDELHKNTELMKTMLFVAGVLTLASCTNHNDPVDSPRDTPKERVDVPLTVGERQLLETNTDFAFRFFKQVCLTETERPNLFVSPLSASLCLSMISNGAAGNTLDEMQKTLGFPASSFSLSELNAYNRKLTSALLELDNTADLGIANSIWIRRGFDVRPSFVALNKSMYDADVRELDFNAAESPDVINKWCADKTNNRITKVVDEIPGVMKMFLINALYFKGSWKTPFDKEATLTEKFRLPDGSTKNVSMMNATGSYRYAKNEHFAMAELPYGNEAFSMVLFLPDEHKSPAECLDLLTAENWRQWSQKMYSATLEMKLPRFKVEYRKDLRKDMAALGMKDAFNPEAADFSAMVSPESARLHIGLLDQFTYIQVDESGTEAAAVTVGGMMETSMPADPVPFHVDRPFAFLIKEKSTGAILFMGKITDLSQ